MQLPAKAQSAKMTRTKAGVLSRPTSLFHDSNGSVPVASRQKTRLIDEAQQFSESTNRKRGTSIIFAKGAFQNCLFLNVPTGLNGPKEVLEFVKGALALNAQRQHGG
jgi:hypothetical protein